MNKIIITVGTVLITGAALAHGHWGYGCGRPCPPPLPPPPPPCHGCHPGYYGGGYGYGYGCDPVTVGVMAGSAAVTVLGGIVNTICR